MRKYQWLVIIVLIVYAISFSGCERVPKMMKPLLPDTEPAEDMMKPESTKVMETPADPSIDAVVELFVEPIVEPEMPAVTEGTVRPGLPVVSIDPAVIVSPSVGEQFTVRINIKGGKNVAGYNIDVSFDPTALSYVSSANSDYLPAGAFPVPIDVYENKLTIAAVSLTGAASDSDGALATITFEVVKAKASTIGLAHVILADPIANALENTTANGIVTAP